MDSVATSSRAEPPEIGQLVEVRSRQWVVAVPRRYKELTLGEEGSAVRFRPPPAKVRQKDICSDYSGVGGRRLVATPRVQLGGFHAN